MFGKRLKLFSLFGFSVQIDASWLIIAALITWSLAAGYFPAQVKGLAVRTYWWMGVAGAVGLFASIVFHEMCHSLVARRYGLAMRGITLFIFGGVAEMEREPASAKAEFLMAAAGPLSSFVLAGGFYLSSGYAGGHGWPPPVVFVLAWLAAINTLLALFNLVPAFPLDGGRILRSALWAWKGKLGWATRIASAIGSGFGLALIVLGVIQIIRGDFIGGMWWFLIGMFLRNAAQASFQQLVLRRALEGEPIRRFMRANPVTVPNWISLREFVEDYVYRHHFKMFPVVNNGRLTGCVRVEFLKDIPRDEWERHSVQEVQTSCSWENTVSPDIDALRALQLMNRSGFSRLMVVDRGELVGIVSLHDLLEFLTAKLDLEGDEAGSERDQKKAA